MQKRQNYCQQAKYVEKYSDLVRDITFDISPRLQQRVGGWGWGLGGGGGGRIFCVRGVLTSCIDVLRWSLEPGTLGTIPISISGGQRRGKVGVRRPTRVTSETQANKARGDSRQISVPESS